MLLRKPACDWLIVGLGNPGDNYSRTRHNAGFRAVDILGDKLGVKIDRAKYRGLYGQGTYRGQKLILLKPQTFMNLSGLSVMDAARFYKLPPERIIVLFDDISLDVGRLRIRGTAPQGVTTGSSPLSVPSIPRASPGSRSAWEPSPTRTMSWQTGSCPPSARRRRRPWHLPWNGRLMPASPW